MDRTCAKRARTASPENDPGVTLPSAQQTTLVRVSELHIPPNRTTTPEGRSAAVDSTNERSLLANLLEPLGESDFLQHYFRQCAVHVGDRDERKPPAVAFSSSSLGEQHDRHQAEAAAVQNQPSPRFQHLCEQLGDLDPEYLFHNTASENIFVWLLEKPPEKDPKDGNNKRPPRTSRLLQSIEVSDAETALTLHRTGGHATYCRAPPNVEQYLVASLLEATGLGCGQYDGSGERVHCLGRGEVEVFLSTTKGHVTDWHYDFQENFTLQLSGIKRWTLQKGTVQHPLLGCTPHYASPGVVESQLLAAQLADPSFQFQPPNETDSKSEEVETVDMKPGDVLYFPAGMWHRVEVVEPGVSINISLMATNYASLVCGALQHVLVQKDEWRACVTNNSQEQVLKTLRHLLEKLPSDIRQFTKEGGAEFIIPPVLRHGKQQQLLNTNQDDSEHENDEGGALDEDQSETPEEEGQPIDIMNFHAPFLPPYRLSSSELVEWTCEKMFQFNPLASFIPETAITSYYGEQSANDSRAHRSKRDTATEALDDEDDDDRIFVLNAGFAGNEDYESLVRVRIKVHRNHVQTLLRDYRTGTPPATSILVRGGYGKEEDRRLLDCLFYHGYFTWVPVSELLET